MSRDRVRLALVLPDLLGTYGDRGNVLVLALWLIAASGAAGFVLMKWVREWRAT